MPLQPNMPLHYSDDGVGDVIVFLHGMAASSRYWQAYVPLLSNKHRLIRLDLLGFGKSPQSDNGYSVDSHCQAIAETLQQLDVRSFTLVGHSMGALLALQYAQRYPSQITKLVLISMPVYTSAEQSRIDITKSKKRYRYAYYGASSRILCTIWCSILRPISRRLAPWYLPKQPKHVAQDSVLHSWKSYSQSMTNVIEQQSVAADLKQLKIPAHLIYGTDESQLILANVRALKLTPNIELQFMAGGHNLPLEQTKAISRLL